MRSRAARDAAVKPLWLSDRAGKQYLCYTPILGKASNTPTPEACSELDDWVADQF